jgi:hypothetical protein
MGATRSILDGKDASREKWFAFLRGEDVGPLVSPLCCEWKLAEPYRWPYDDRPPPFPRSHLNWQITEQLAVAKVCGWDQRFLAYLPFTARNQAARCVERTQALPGGGTRTERRIATPYGDLSQIEEKKKSAHVLKEWLETKDDFRKAIWVTRQEIDFEKDRILEEGRQLRAAVGERGPLGTFWGPPLINFHNKAQVYYHMADFPDEFAELHAASVESSLTKLEIMRAAGIDFLFYCVDGTDWISPAIFEKYFLETTRRMFKIWRDLGGFILWHSCGRVRILIEAGYYNQLKPEIFETLSEPPVGDVPSLAWARRKLDRGIITLGNIPLPTLLYGSEEDVRAEVRRVKEQTRGYRHMVGLTDDVLEGTPLRNALALVDEARNGGSH